VEENPFSPLNGFRGERWRLELWKVGEKIGRFLENYCSFGENDEKIEFNCGEIGENEFDCDER
jgi:hypothetical protein